MGNIISVLTLFGSIVSSGGSLVVGSMEVIKTVLSYWGDRGRLSEKEIGRCLLEVQNLLEGIGRPGDTLKDTAEEALENKLKSLLLSLLLKKRPLLSRFFGWKSETIQKIEEDIRSAVGLFETFQRFDFWNRTRQLPDTLLLESPGGCGVTQIMTFLALMCDLEIVTIYFCDTNTESVMQKIDTAAKKHSIVVVDRIDSMTPPVILNLTSKVKKCSDERKSVIFVATTGNVNKLETKLGCPVSDHFSHSVFIPPPSEKMRYKLIENESKKLKVGYIWGAEEYDILAKRTDRFSIRSVFAVFENTPRALSHGVALPVAVCRAIDDERKKLGLPALPKPNWTAYAAKTNSRKTTSRSSTGRKEEGEEKNDEEEGGWGEGKCGGGGGYVNTDAQANVLSFPASSSHPPSLPATPPLPLSYPATPGYDTPMFKNDMLPSPSLSMTSHAPMPAYYTARYNQPLSSPTTNFALLPTDYYQSPSSTGGYPGPVSSHAHLLPPVGQPLSSVSSRSHLLPSVSASLSSTNQHGLLPSFGLSLSSASHYGPPSPASVSLPYGTAPPRLPPSGRFLSSASRYGPPSSASVSLPYGTAPPHLPPFNRSPSATRDRARFSSVGPSFSSANYRGPSPPVRISIPSTTQYAPLPPVSFPLDSLTFFSTNYHHM